MMSWQLVGNMRGKSGDAGLSAYDIACADGFAGTLGEWLASMRGAPGESVIGERGAKGEPGESIVGPKGDAGESAYDIARKEGFTGSRFDWAQSLRGKDGATGDPGRDALQIDILPVIDETRSYPRGTYARVRGAVCKSTRATGPLTGTLDEAGWAVIWDAPLPDIEMMQGDDLRTFTFRASYASGKVAEKSFKVPVVLDRGLWNRDKGYELADMVGYGGQIWTAQGDTKGEQPGASPSWRLTVRKGRDAASAESPKQHNEPVRIR